MAREYALIGTGIWSEESILELSPLEQHAYFVVHTQPDMSRCGVVPYTLRRWAKLSNGHSATKLRAALRGLEQRRQIVIDESTEEVLDRPYIRHDGLLRQPQVVGAMVRDFRSISSPLISTAILAELRRIWHIPGLHDSDRRGLRIALGVVENDKQQEAVGVGLSVHMTEAIAQGLVQPFHQALLQGLPEGLGKALARPSYPSPSPNASPNPNSGVVVQREQEVEVDVPRETLPHWATA